MLDENEQDRLTGAVIASLQEPWGKGVKMAEHPGGPPVIGHGWPE